MRVSISDIYYKSIDEKVILINIVGVLESIKNNAITIDEAEKFIFSPYTRKKLCDINCDARIIEIVEKGCELEDIASLIPECFDEEIARLEEESFQLLKTYSEYKNEFWIEE